MAEIAQLELVGAGGEPVDLRRTIASHGLVDLPPFRPAADLRALEVTVATSGGARTIRIAERVPGRASVEVVGRAAARAVREELLATAAHVLRLDADLSAFYDVAARDPELAWVTQGAGRMVRSATVFEDVVKTICTTNCAWSATVRMVTALVENLGDPAPDGRRAFPTPRAMCGADEAFYRDVVRAGYRGAYLRSLARKVDEGELDLEAWRRATPDELSDDELAAQLLALPGVGPYAAAHIMMIGLGRYSRLILDSWTRPTYAKLRGRPATDEQIVRRFRRYGPWAGLAFWLYLTRGWVED